MAKFAGILAKYTVLGTSLNAFLTPVTPSNRDIGSNVNNRRDLNDNPSMTIIFLDETAGLSKYYSDQ
jgi:hypothetical protein